MLYFKIKLKATKRINFITEQQTNSYVISNIQTLFYSVFQIRCKSRIINIKHSTVYGIAIVILIHTINNNCYMQSDSARAEIRDQLRANQGLPKFVGRETCYVDVFARSECGACTGIMIIFIFLFTICGLTSVPLDLIRL